jgi:adenine-specific DNA-methyltransferase
MSEQFEDALTTAAILLIERSPTPRISLSTYFVEHTAPLASLRNAVWNSRSEEGIKHQHFQSSEIIALEKWDKALRDGLAVERTGFIPLGKFAKSRRGIATGANEFFFVSLDDANRNEIRPENTKPCVGRSEQVPGLLFSTNDFLALEAKNARTRLLDLPKLLSETEARYVEAGLKEGLHERYLLASRKPWYSMERREPAPIWAAVFGRTSLRFIYNEAGVSNLTTFHCIYPIKNDPVFCRALVACLNSRIVQEMAEHQRRVYGGGLLKFEPKDLLSIQVPDLTNASIATIENLAAACVTLDLYLRENSTLPLSFLDELDQLVLEAAASTNLATLF